MTNNNETLIIENLINYKYNFGTRNIIVNKYNNNDNNDKYKNDKSYYFILDSGSNDNYYWIYESFIFIQLLFDLNIKHNNNIKLLTNTNNNIFLQSLLTFFNINNEIVNSIDNYNNITYSPLIYSIYYNHQVNNDNYFNKYLNIYLNYINNNLDNNGKNTKNILINNNTNNFDNTKINNFIINNNGLIIEKDNNDIKKMLSIINNAENIYIYYNSYFYYICMFLKNKNINIIENNLYRPNGIYTQICGNPTLKYLYYNIKNNNNINIINL